MPASDQISETIFHEAITRAVQDVFKTMFGLPAGQTGTPRVLEEGAAEEPIMLLDGKVVVGTVGFVGDISGLIYLYLDSDFAERLAGQLLGMSAEELVEGGDEVVNDVVGELTNMTVGTFKNQLCDRGFPCRLTIPSILRGSNFSVEPITAAIRRIYTFEIEGHTLVADLLLKRND